MHCVMSFSEIICMEDAACSNSFCSEIPIGIIFLNVSRLEADGDISGNGFAINALEL